IKNVVKTSAAGQAEFSHHHEGSERWFSASISPLGEGEAPIEEVIVIIKEVTEEKKNKWLSEYKNKLINQLTSIKDGPLLHVIEGDPLKYNFVSGDLSSLVGY